MWSKIMSWFDKDDDTFMASIGDEKSRNKLLAGLRKARMLGRIIIWLGSIVLAASSVFGQYSNPSGLFLVIIVGMGIGMNCDYRIKIILMASKN